MNPNPDQIARIRDFVAGLADGWATPHAQIRAAMKSTTVANPAATRPTVPKPFAAIDLADACSSANRVNLEGYLVGAAALIIAQDAAHLSDGLDAMVPIGSITSADAAAMKAAMAQTQPDPSWTSTVPWDAGTLGRDCDDFDLEIARP